MDWTNFQILTLGRKLTFPPHAYLKMWQKKQTYNVESLPDEEPFFDDAESFNPQGNYDTS